MRGNRGDARVSEKIYSATQRAAHDEEVACAAEGASVRLCVL